MDPKERKAPSVGDVVYKAAEVEVGEDRSITFIASDETVDRYGDIIRADKWELENFYKNPVLLFGHKSSEPPIGRVVDCKVKGKKLLAKCEFMPEGMHDFADKIWNMVKAKFLNAVSVGFYPTCAPNCIRDDKNEYVTGYEFVGQELIELSVVPVPANPNALALAKSIGMQDESMRKMFVDYEAFQKQQAEAEEEVLREVSRSHQLYRGRLRLAKLGVSGTR